MADPVWPAYRAYLFDLDGTLIDTAPDLHRALNETLAAAGFTPAELSQTRHWIGHGARAMLASALATHNADQDEVLDTLLPDFLRRYQANPVQESEIYPTVIETLPALRALPAKLGVVTNKATRFTLPILDALNLTTWFDEIVCGDTTDEPKPSAKPVHFALQAMNVAPEHALFVGDSNTDVLAARAAGVQVVCVRDGYNQGQDVGELDVDGVIDRFSELIPATDRKSP